MTNMETPLKTTREWAGEYVAAGFALCAIHANDKKPVGLGWGTTNLNLDTLVPGNGLGIVHARSRTCVIDFDDMAKAGPYFVAKGIDIEALLNADDAVQIVSGKTNRAKLLYRLPPGEPTPLTYQRLKFVEFRCAGSDNSPHIQDVLPPSMHPGTVNPKTKEVLIKGVAYTWGGRGSFAELPVIPKELFDHWKSLVSATPAIKDYSAFSSNWDLDQITIDQTNDLKSALKTIPNDDYNLWIYVCLALKSQGEAGFALMDEWSRGDLNLPEPLDYDYDDNLKYWDQVSPKAIGYRSIFNMATTDYGCTNPKLGVSKSVQEAQRTEAQFMAELDTDTECTFGEVLELGADRPAVVPPMYFVDMWIPQGEVTLFSGHGGSGKSYVALTLAVHIALGIDFGDLPVTQAIAYFLSAEDRVTTLNRRLDPICAHLKHADGSQVRVAHLQGKLFIVDATKEQRRSLYAREKTQELAKLAKHVRAVNAQVVFVDNASNAFTGNEIDRNEVTNFLQAMQMYVAGDEGAVVMISHVSKAAAAGTAAEDYSGSTAWHNGTRSRLSLIPGKRVEGKPKTLTIEQSKATHSDSAPPLAMVWDKQTFVPLTQKGMEIQTTARKDDAMKDLKDRILRALDRAAKTKTEISASRSGTARADLMIKNHGDFDEKITVKEFFEAFDSLTIDGAVLIAEVSVKSNSRKFYTLAVGWDLL